MRHNLADVAIGLCFAAGGAFLAIQALALPTMPGMPAGPGLFPLLTGAGMVLFGLVLAFQAWVAGPSDDLPLIHGEVAGEPAPHADRRRLFSPFVLGVLGCTAAAILVMSWLGFLITGVLFTFAIVLMSGGTLRAAIVFSPIAAAAIFLLFSRGFRVPLPHGILG